MKILRNLFVLAVITSLLSFSGGRRLTFNLNNRDIYKLELKADQEISQEIDGQTRDVSTEITSVISFRILEKNEDNIYKMEVWYDKMRILIESVLYNIEMDSERDPENGDIMDQIVKGLVNRPFIVEMTETGDVITISGLDGLYDDVLKPFNFFDANTVAELKKAIEKSFGEKALEGNIEMLTAFLPNTEVKEGDSWKNKVNLKSLLSGEVENVYSLEEINNDVCVINMSSDIFSSDNKSYLKYEGTPTKYYISGVQNGKIKIDEKSGWILEGDVTQKMSGLVRVKKCDEFPDGMEWPVHFTTKVSYKSLN